jgi:inorganic pyrophosphatase
MNLQDISLGRHAPSIINVVIEAPKGSKKKYRYHAKSGRFRLAYEFSMPVPTEYGWIPETTAEDGHFLNAMVIARNSSHPGYVCEARPIGILKRKDRDHHVICVLLGDERYASVKDISDLDVKLLKKIVQFFEPYFELSGWLNRAETIEVIKEAHEAYVAGPKSRSPDARIDNDPEDDEDAEGFDANLEETRVAEADAERVDHDDQGEVEDADSDN